MITDKRCNNRVPGLFAMFTPYTRAYKGRTFIVSLLCLGLAGLLNGCSDSTKGLQEPEPVGGPALMRRLSEAQYRATIADIFGSDTPVVARFEPEIRSHGLTAIGSSEAGISPFSMEQYMVAALAIADYVLSDERRSATISCQPQTDTDFDKNCASQFIEQYGPLLFRRPLTAEQFDRLLTAARESSTQLGDFYQGLKYALVAMLTSPDFLLRIEQVMPVRAETYGYDLDAYSKAERLSFFLTNSSPDKALLQAAAEGELDTTDGLAKQVDRLIGSASFDRAVRAFFTDMLEFDLFDDVTKDISIYPAYDSTVALDAQEQTLRDITRHLIANEGDYRNLFTLRETELTRPLGVVYRQAVARRNGWELTEFTKDSHRQGIHNHISFLAIHSHPGRSSPSLRGAAIREVFLCQEVPDPPADVDFSAVQDAANGDMPTARDRLEIHNSQPACSGCHKIMDPPGLALENFDGLGSFRRRENGVEIDASGTLDGVPFNNPAEFAQALRNHRETPRCVTEKMYRYAVGRDTVWDERAYMDYLIDGFAQSGYRIPQLMRNIALSKNFFAIDVNASAELHTQNISLDTASTKQGNRS